MKKTGLFSAVFKAVGYIALFLFCQVITSLLCEAFFAAILLKKGLSDSEFATALMNAQNKNLYLIMLISYLLFLGISVLIKKKEFLPAVGAKKAPRHSLLTSFLLGLGAYPVVVWLVTLASMIPSVAQSQSDYGKDLEIIASAGGSLFIEILAVAVIGPVFEELLFRGFVLNTLKKATSPAFAIFLTALGFGLVHGNLYQLIFTLPLGILMGFLAHRFDSLWPSVLMHIAFNTSNYLPRIGLYLGYPEEHWVTVFIYLAFSLLYPFALIVALILYRKFFGKKKETAFPKNMAEFKNFIFEEGDPLMAAPEFMVVGLGNPGDKYQNNRHNAGFMALDYISEKENIPMKNLRFQSLCGESTIGDKKVLFLKPQTFMNLSGQAVREAAAFYKIPAEKILVIFDDINFAPGVFRIREKGSAGGHNGIKSIISSLGTDAFPRVKMGVGKVPEGWDLMHHVLGNLPAEDQKKLDASLPSIAHTVRLFAEGDLNRAGALYNGKEHG